MRPTARLAETSLTRRISTPAERAKNLGVTSRKAISTVCVERELGPMAQALNLGVLAWSPLARGVLTGKYHGEGKADGGRMTNEGLKAFLPEEQHAASIISAVKSVAEQTGRSMAQVALAWL